jgi:hypothetical protein
MQLTLPTRLPACPAPVSHPAARVPLQARVAALLKEHPSAGQAFCRLLVAPYLHYIEGGKGEWEGMD